MVAASAIAIFPCTPEQFCAIVSDYERYPEFISEIKQCRVVRSEGDKKLVEFHVSGIKTFSYRLWITENPPERIAWRLESSDLFDTSVGSWSCGAAAGKTQAKYSVDVTFKVFVPGLVAQALMNVNVANTVSAFRRRVEALLGAR
jgi:ribosome-associated toxin RatA of RatAB toxin-antitoxin module